MSEGARRPSILFVTNTLGLAGAEKVLMALLEDIDRARYDVNLLSLIPLGEMFMDVPEGVRVLNARTSPVSVLSAHGHRAISRQVARSLLHPRALGRFLVTLPRNLRWQWKRRREAQGIQLDKLCWELLADAAPRLKHPFDLAVAYLEGGATYYVAKHVRAGRKAAFIHVDYQQAGYCPAQDAPFYRAYDAVFGVSSDVVRSVLQSHPWLTPKIHVFLNRVNRARIQAQAKEPGGFDDAFTGLRLLTVGRLHPQKAIDVAAEALALLRSRGINARWYVLGDGPEREPLERVIAKLGMTEDFRLLGSTRNPYPYMAQCDIYVQPSRFEGWGLAITEALSLGRPVVATACAGAREQVISGENGLLIGLPPNAEELASAILRMTQDTDLQANLARYRSEVSPKERDAIETLYTLAQGGELPPDWSE